MTTIRNISQLEGPQFLHIITRKGKGYGPAEEDPVKWHAVSKPFDPETGKSSAAQSAKPARPTFSQVFSDWVCDMAARDPRLVAVTPAMREGSGLVRFEQEYPDRYFDVAIAEQHSVTVAAGMACDGLKPVVAIYSTFLQRAYDQVVHDVVNQKLPVLFAIDRAGVVGADGPTHNGSYDFSFLRCLPHMVVMAPADENECRQMLYTGFLLDQPAAVRYPRGSGPGATVEKEMTALPLGKGEVRLQGEKIAILAYGTTLKIALEAGEELGATVANMRFVKPLDGELAESLAASHDLLVTVEENVVQGGAGSAVNEYLASRGITQRILNYGLPDRLLQHGSQQDMLEDAKLTREGLLEFIGQN